MYHEYPYTTYYHDIDKLCACCKAAGLRLEVQGDYLRLVKVDGGEVVSNVKIHYADTALTDKDGKAIEAYIFDVGTDGTHVVFTHGDNSVSSIEVPYAEKAKYDLSGKDLLDYVYSLSVAGNKLRITKGDLTVAEITVPYAVAASETVDGKDLTTFAASLAAEGNELVLRDAKGRYLNRVTVAYATHAATADSATQATEADHATSADTATNADNADNADYATVAADALNAVETITVVGDQIVFTTYDDQSFSITAPYAVKAQKDDIGNTIKTTYCASAINDPDTGELKLLDALGNVIVTLQPVVTSATYDSNHNLIADYVKTIVASANSDYVTVTHGTGATDSIKINYANIAWKDTNNNVIKNTYIKRLACEEDVEDGHYKLVAYNGDDPEAVSESL